MTSVVEDRPSPRQTRRPQREDRRTRQQRSPRQAEEEHWEDLMAERAAIEPEFPQARKHAASPSCRKSRRRPTRMFNGMPEVIKPAAEFAGRDVTRMDYREAREGALRIIGDKEQTTSCRRTAGGPRQARPLRPVDGEACPRHRKRQYISAWKNWVSKHSRSIPTKTLKRPPLRRVPGEDEGTTTHGGFAIPVSSTRR